MHNNCFAVWRRVICQFAITDDIPHMSHCLDKKMIRLPPARELILARHAALLSTCDSARRGLWLMIITSTFVQIKIRNFAAPRSDDHNRSEPVAPILWCYSPIHWHHLARKWLVKELRCSLSSFFYCCAHHVKFILVVDILGVTCATRSIVRGKEKFNSFEKYN